MKYLTILFFVFALAACGNGEQTTNNTGTPNADSLDSVHKVEDEVAEEIIEGSFDALNR